MPFVPKKAMNFKRLGNITKVHRKCFPGYVFIQSVYPPVMFLNKVFPIIYPIKEAYKFLHYGEDRYGIALREHERLSLLSLFGKNFVAECLIGIIDGDMVRIISSSFSGIEGMVRKIIPRKREVVVDIPFMGDIRPVTLGLDIIEKIS